MKALELAHLAHAASSKMALTTPEDRKRFIYAFADGIDSKRGEILAANERDAADARSAGLSSALVDRLVLNSARLDSMIQAARQVAELPDILGEVLRDYSHSNGLIIKSRRVPIGVVLMIYESRPNVSSDAASLGIKSGNAVILRGGKEARRSNMAIISAMNGAARAEGIPEQAVLFVENQERDYLSHLLSAEQYIDLVIPRGGEGLIRAVSEQSRIPVIKHYKGVCHIYVDKSADFTKALDIIENAKCQRPGVCNAAETLLVDRDIAAAFLPQAAERLLARGVELRADKAAIEHIPRAKPASEDDWNAEYLDLILAVKVVDGAKSAIEHINTYGSKHSDAIVAQDMETQQLFMTAVDSAAVYSNASTRFTDGSEFGLGAEIGISTDKFHARGPMGIEGLTTYKYYVYGSGQIRS